eukprot:CAMPEP_0174854438 /NCGR_PEP_ID=MMETSP1114-20130205/31154_1 /TAXON_ID=312471 /ORGANISM="Neobodo designis, Strain CCAP 1951/1" /LENGTH=62 /DNA_ID=CAMNT_0016089131 /DNA_START=30 /DNA_END=214 /DNA_ORIENTATION=-
MGKPKRAEPAPQTEASFVDPLPDDLQCAICHGHAALLLCFTPCSLQIIPITSGAVCQPGFGT